MSRRVVVVTAGLSRPSTTRLLADQLGAAVASAVSGRGEAAELAVLEVRDLATDLATRTTTGVSTPDLTRALDLVASADGLVAVTPVFSGSYSGLFKMFFDAVEPDTLDGMPVLIGATAGTARHSLVLDHAMRPLFTYLRAVVVPTGVFAATEDFGGGEADALTGRISRAAAQLAALVVAEPVTVGGFAPDLARPRRHRDRGQDRDRDTPGLPAGVSPFADLLRGHTGE